jgi:uncharacterized protein YbjQ (UPF0145 family)
MSAAIAPAAAEWPVEWFRSDELAEEIELYACAWVPGTRVHAYFGPVSAEIFLHDSDVKDRSSEWVAAQSELLDKLRNHARVKRANAVIGLEMSLDPFARCPRSGASGLHLYAVGTAAKLEALV